MRHVVAQPQVLEAEARRYPAIESIACALGGAVEVVEVPIPLGCCHGFNEAYFGRPEMFLDSGARRSCSAWSFVDRAEVATGIATLERDLANGEWDRRHGSLRTRPHFSGSLRLLIARPAP